MVAFVVRARGRGGVVAFDLHRVEVPCDGNTRFVPCPNCGNSNVEDFAQDVGDQHVLCMVCNEEFDPKDFR